MTRNWMTNSQHQTTTTNDNHKADDNQRQPIHGRASAINEAAVQ